MPLSNEGKDLVLSPGIFPLSNSLKVKHPNQVILGLGFATLNAPDDGSPCIHVLSQVPGVRIAGLMLEASVLKGVSEGKTASLLEWGEQTSNDPGDETNPGVLSDVFARVGGLKRDVSTDVMIRLLSGNIYGDNLWLWRADHTQLQPNEVPNFPGFEFWQTVKEESVVQNGLVVERGATNVTIVGLAVEHTTEDQVIWKGDFGENPLQLSDSFLLLSLTFAFHTIGQVFFYQSELPYDADSSFTDNGYVGYRVESTYHKAMGLGIYSNFRDHDIDVKTAIQVPNHHSDGFQMMNMFTVKLDNMGKISSVVNGKQHADTGNGIIHRCINLTVDAKR